MYFLMILMDMSIPIVHATNNNVVDEPAASHTYTDGKWNVLWDVQYVSRRQAVDEITGQYGSADSYFISNVAMNYKFSKEAILQLGIQNVFNRVFYDDEATAGRTYSASMKFKF